MNLKSPTINKNVTTLKRNVYNQLYTRNKFLSFYQRTVPPENAMPMNQVFRIEHHEEWPIIVFQVFLTTIVYGVVLCRFSSSKVRFFHSNSTENYLKSSTLDQLWMLLWREAFSSAVDTCIVSKINQRIWFALNSGYVSSHKPCERLLQTSNFTLDTFYCHLQNLLPEWESRPTWISVS